MPYKSTNFFINYLNQNEINSPSRTVGLKDQLFKNVYNSFNFFAGYEPGSLSNISPPLLNKHRKNHGPIYDLCFSPDGKQLIAGTEENALLIFDPLNHQLVGHLDDAHENSINNIKFLDSNLFATGSNDKKISIWDNRNMKNQLKTLADAHSHFIKNLEYDSNLRYLVSSGFDGTVNIYDLYNTSPDQLDPGFVRTRPQDCPFKKVLSLNCLMRMRMTHDCTKMIICTVEGYIMVIHDLDLTTLKEDLIEFQSDLYRLMQKKNSVGFDFGSWFNSLFKSKRNRVELISDFPTNNEAHLIGSLDVHPQDWCILSRNLSRDENSEWTCVHNIQDNERPNEMMYIEMPKTDSIYFPHAFLKGSSEEQIESEQQQSSRGASSQVTENNATSNTDESPANNRVSVNSANSNQDSSMVNEESNPNDLHISPLIIISARSSRRAHATLLNPNTSYRQIRPGTNRPPKIYKNLKRMTHYLEELNVYKLFFKEPHFSPCGRFIVSPYSFGFRLLSFNAACSELSDQMLSSTYRAPQKLNEINTYTNHTNYVTTANFSPTHHLIASGCLNGLVNFYQPNI